MVELLICRLGEHRTSAIELIGQDRQLSQLKATSSPQWRAESGLEWCVSWVPPRSGDSCLYFF
jgi:hypothetical protein